MKKNDRNSAVERETVIRSYQVHSSLKSSAFACNDQSVSTLRVGITSLWFSAIISSMFYRKLSFNCVNNTVRKRCNISKAVRGPQTKRAEKKIKRGSYMHIFYRSLCEQFCRGLLPRLSVTNEQGSCITLIPII